jgi:GTP cyclohydrolase I
VAADVRAFEEDLELNHVPTIDVRAATEAARAFLKALGVAHVGYLPKDRILGLSKLARLVEYFALRQPQVQERLTEQIVDWLDTTLAPRGAGAVLEAEHLCMTMRGVQAPGTRAITSALRGVLLEQTRTRVEFFGLTGVSR